MAAARAFCGSNGLAIIDNAAENVRAAAACGTNMCWIDLEDYQYEVGTWKWNATDEFPRYTNWNQAYSQPGGDYGIEKYSIIDFQIEKSIIEQ